MPAAPTLHNAATRRQRKHLAKHPLRVALLPALCVLVLWSVLQFVLIEGAFRYAKAAEAQKDFATADAFYALANQISWPANELYVRKEIELHREALAEMLEGEKLSREGSLYASRLLEELYAFDPDVRIYALIETQGLLEERGEVILVSTHTQWLIYGGVCAAWGLAVSMAVLLALTIRAELRQRAR